MRDVSQTVEPRFDAGVEVDDPHHARARDPDPFDIFDEAEDEYEDDDADDDDRDALERELDADDELRLRRVMHRLRMRFDPEVDRELEREVVCPIRHAVSGEIVL